MKINWQVVKSAVNNSTQKKEKRLYRKVEIKNFKDKR